MTGPVLPRWILVWLCVGYAIIAWDVAFVLLRPASLPDGSLGALWAIPYARYIAVDHSYADLANPFIWAQAIMSLFELALVLVALGAVSRRQRGRAHLLAFCASALTAAKTSLILLVEALSGFANIGHNAPLDAVLLYLLPNAVWIVVPLGVAFVTGRRLLRGVGD